MAKRFCSILLLTLMLASVLTACGGNSAKEGPLNLAVVCCRRANIPTLSVSSSELTEAIMASTASYGSVCLIANDGAPYVAAGYNINNPDKNLSDSKRAEIARQQTAQILSVLDATVAKASESDTLSAISLAARSFSEKVGSKELLIIDSGLSTCGYVDFTQNLLRADSKTVIDYLSENEALPNLAGVSVLWVGLGDVSYPQETLSAHDVNALRTIWQDILTASGAASVTFSAELPSAARSEESLPFVTPIPVLQYDPIDISACVLSQPVVLDEEKILFMPDSAELADPATATETLRPIADYLSKNPDIDILLAGTTATAGTDENCKRLSFTRAATIEHLLADMGVPNGQISAVIGLGYDHEFHVPDIGADGKLNGNAGANRSVILFDASSDAAQKLIRKYS